MGMSLIHNYGFLADKDSNLSLPGVFKSQAYVTHPTYGDCVVDRDEVKAIDPKKGVVIYVHNGTTHASGFTYATVIDVYKGKKAVVPSGELTKMTLRRFFLWRNPYSGWSIGRHGIIAGGLRYLAFLLFIAYCVTQLKYGWGWGLGIVAAIAIIGLMIRGLIRNFEGKQM